MTKEGLEKEVEEYLENEHCKNVCACDEVEECKKGIRIKCMSFYCKKELIVNFSEPREKLIAELEAQIEKMKRCEICKHYRWNHCSYETNILADCIQNKLKHFELKEIKEK